MTNSPPSKVKLEHNEHARVLASGIDSLVLALSVSWSDRSTFRKLAALKTIAKQEKEDEPAELIIANETSPWRFVVKPHGAGGFEWLITSQELGMKIGNWLEPQQRPSVMVDIRSETLWAHGPEGVVNRILALIEGLGGEVVEVKVSRLDLCVDTLIRSENWTKGLIDSFVSRARKMHTHYQSRELSGFSIGKGKLRARLYDKPMEIKAKSKKTWMYDIWGIETVGDENRVVRTEFQLRREALLELGMGEWKTVLNFHHMIWGYCATMWLKLVDDASLHHTQQQLLPWWNVVESGFHGIQNAEPLVRDRSVHLDKRQLAAQAIGSLSSLLSIDLSPTELESGDKLDRESHLLLALKEALNNINYGDEEFTRRMRRKQAKHHRSGPDFHEPAFDTD
tara:strand:- start:4611 stop:5795 length:1185 start_codon:yes stop_codon:yes gene_type:complete